MNQILTNGWLQLLFYFAVLLVCVKPLGIFMARIYDILEGLPRHVPMGPRGSRYVGGIVDAGPIITRLTMTPSS